MNIIRFAVFTVTVSLGASLAMLALLTPLPAEETVAPGDQTAPQFEGIDTWLNSDPLSMDGLRGKVVLVDFWTYTCINCLNHLPHVKDWHARYKDQGLVVVGVHTPEFAFEKSTRNVREAIGRLRIEHAVAQDNSYGTWRAFRNQYWPAIYLIDKEGRIAYQHFGEGRYRDTESKIQALLAQPS